MLFIVLIGSLVFLSLFIGTWLKQCEVLETQGLSYDLPSLYFRKNTRYAIRAISAIMTTIILVLVYRLIAHQGEAIAYGAVVFAYISKHLITSVLGMKLVGKTHDLEDIFGRK